MFDIGDIVSLIKGFQANCYRHGSRVAWLYSFLFELAKNSVASFRSRAEI